MKAKVKYEYKVGNVGVATREAARIIQRSVRAQAIATGDVHQVVPRIIQKLTVERVVR